jgi:nitrogen fixation/metabolism regulation signal transduction histidine kinase
MTPKDEKPMFTQRRYLVNRRFQFKYTAMVVLFSSVIFAVLGYELYRRTLANTEILKIQNLDVKALVTGQDRQILYLLAGFFILQVASLFVLGILITHRIAGPLFRVHRYLEEIAESGRIRPLNPVRSRDEFHEFFESLAKVVLIFQTRTEEQKAKLQEARKAIDAARQDPEATTRARLLLDEIEKTL